METLIVEKTGNVCKIVIRMKENIVPEGFIRIFQSMPKKKVDRYGSSYLGMQNSMEFI